MAPDGTLAYAQRVHTFTSSGVWVKPEQLVHARLVLAGAGGGGWGDEYWIDAGAGGGGGAAVQSPWIAASQLPESVEVVVGQSAPWTDGGESRFLDYRAPGGRTPPAWNVPGAGGLAPWRGGDGGAPGQSGESVSLLPIHLLAGGGGGAGSGSDTWGGASGMNIRADGTTTSAAPLFAAGVLQCGHGGARGRQTPQWPAGGGGVGQAGAAGVVTVIETTFVMED